ncbi:MAG TPA: hypothetical protein VE990_18380 [Acidimicrobiales bacterium]|nr:hypothetical protein [Acidimicrobiales bacterium]
MSSRRWVNNTQPQTLQIAVILLYLNAVFLAVAGYLFSPFGLAVVAGQVLGAFGVANERKWGYLLALVVACLPLALLLMSPRSILGANLLTLMFQVALVALLVHPHSRDYRRIWFK